jgi:hypothetical protein
VHPGGVVQPQPARSLIRLGGGVEGHRVAEGLELSDVVADLALRLARKHDVDGRPCTILNPEGLSPAGETGDNSHERCLSGSVVVMAGRLEQDGGGIGGDAGPPLRWRPVKPSAAGPEVVGPLRPNNGPRRLPIRKPTPVEHPAPGPCQGQQQCP